MQDPIADLLTRLRNGSRAKKRFIDVRWSGIKESIVKILKDKGFVAHFLIKEERKKAVMRVFLKYAQNQELVLQELVRISKPGQRQYISYREIPKVRGGTGITILSTPYGLMEGAEAREKKVGGEYLCVIY